MRTAYVEFLCVRVCVGVGVERGPLIAGLAPWNLNTTFSANYEQNGLE